MKMSINLHRFLHKKVILICLLFWIVFMFLLFVSGALFGSFFTGIKERWVYGILGTVSAFGTTYLFLHFEKKKLIDIGLGWQKNTFTKFIVGLAIGLATFIIILGIFFIFTDLQLQRSHEQFTGFSFLGYLTIIPLALMEEVVFRAYPLISLQKKFGIRITQFIVAIAFALYHVVQGWSIEIALLGPGIWAFVFGLAAFWSKGIAVPTGIHVALNVIQPLIGMKSGTYVSVWMLDHPKGVSAQMLAKTETVGFIIQFLILAGAFIVTEVYIRKLKNQDFSNRA